MAIPTERVEQWRHGFEAEEYEGGLRVELWYPRTGKNVQEVTVGLYDVCAADHLTVRYDFARNGWAIIRDLKREIPGGMEVVAYDQEVAFLPAYHEVQEAEHGA